MRKMYISEKPYFITSRIQKGLPMVPTHNMNLIIEGILAQALELFPVKLCHYKFMQNHFHAVIVALDPGNASSFVGYVKGEIAHAINDMLGVRKGTIWEAGYDSPILLDAETTISKISYLYGNAAKANLVDSIDLYPGVSSWSIFKSSKNSKNCFKVPRDKVFKQSAPNISIYEQIILKKELIKTAKKLELKLEPNAWVGCFEGEVDQEVANKEIIAEVYKLEKELKEERQKIGKKVIGQTRLRLQSMTKKYIPKKYSPRMICLGASKNIRAPFIKIFKIFSNQAKEVYQKWKNGDFSAKIPPGMFAPRKPHLICCLEV